MAKGHLLLSPHARNRKGKKLSRYARQLISVMIDERGLSLRETAKRLHLPGHGQLDKMRRGLLADTPAMKAEIARRKLKADAAWQKSFFGMNGEHVEPVIHKQIVMLKIDEMRKFMEAL